MGATVNTDFTAGASDDWSVAAGSISYDGNGAGFTVAKQGDAPTIQTSAYFFFGTAEVTLQAAPGTGIVSSIVLESDDLDEVDWEALGGDTTQIETNYFGKGYTGSYNRATYVGVSTPQTTFHTYTVNWQRDSIQWLIDGSVVRTLTAAEAGDYFPQTPMRLRIGIWAGGDPTNAPGTIEWAGGQTDYSAGPFTMYLKSVKITNANPGSSYTYGDNSGSADSIEIDGASAPASTTTSVTPTSTHTSTSSSSSSSSSSSTSTSHTSTSPASSTGADTTSAPSSTVSSTKSTAPSSTFSSISSSNPSAVTNPISGITSSNSTLPGSNSTTPSGSTSPTSPSSTSTTAPKAGAAAQTSVTSSVVALYCFLFAIVAYVL
jgi:beta-glucanase (GH16 family)